MKLYYYDHCPFCVRAKMTAGYKQVPVEYIVLLNDDSETCMRLVHKKQVPILEFDDGSAMVESLDIAHKFDEIGEKSRVIVPATDIQKRVTDELSEVSSDINALLYPRNVKASLPEFATKSAIEYFQAKKEKSLGKSFDQAVSETAEHKKNVEERLATLSFNPDNTSNSLSWDDVMIFPTLRNLTIVKDIKMPQQLEDYVKHISALTGVQLYYDRAL
ncbi:glutaredoxin 2 [Bartonella choladocola]|uniref:Glutaredoxin 2 n=1 Tax=Bartonella choladocola TaxID=2750995 RepID=A0A1U9MI82_9HYPH|nr:glutaredoxin 2 [Bartonella choladocola]AQT47448.1 glutaredoxin 2 [Bartonella choladocola]